MRCSAVFSFEMSPNVTLSNKSERKASFKIKLNMSFKLFSKKNYFLFPFKCIVYTFSQ